MATQLFLTGSACGLAAGKLLLSTARGGQSTTAVTTTTNSGTNIQVTASAGGQALTWWFQLGGSGTISGNVTANIRGLESALTVNAGAGIQIDLYAVDGSTFVSTILADTTVPASITEYTTADSAEALAATAPTSTPYTDGQWIVVTLKVRNVGTMASGTVTNSFNGPTGAAAGDTSVTFTETLTEKVQPQPRILTSGTNVNGDGIVTALTPGQPGSTAAGDQLTVIGAWYWTETGTPPTLANVTPPAGWAATGRYRAQLDTTDTAYIIIAEFAKESATGSDTGAFTGDATFAGGACNAIFAKMYRWDSHLDFGDVVQGAGSATSTTTATISSYTPANDAATILTPFSFISGTGTAIYPQGHGIIELINNASMATTHAVGISYQRSKAATGSLAFVGSATGDATWALALDYRKRTIAPVVVPSQVPLIRANAR